MRPWITTAVLSCVLHLPAAAQDAAESRFEEVIDVEVVNLEVYVTDKSGRPVAGLERDDFELWADGREVPVSNFFTVEKGRRVAAGDVRPAPGGGGGRPDVQPSYLVVYVDNVHLGPFTRNRLLDQLEELLKGRVKSGDQVMLASFNGRTAVRQGFTRDWTAIRDTLAEMREDPTFNHLAEQERRSLVSELTTISDMHRNLRALGSPRNKCPRELGRTVERHARQVYSRVQGTVAGLGEFVDTLAYLPGRKAVLHVSDGIPSEPGAELFEYLYELCGGAGAEGSFQSEENRLGLAGINEDDPENPRLDAPDSQLLADAYQPEEAQLDAAKHNAVALFEELATTANAHRVTFYTLEAYGPRNFSATSVGSGDRRTQTRRSDEALRASLQGSLFTLADLTGGKAVLDTSDFAPALAKIGDDLDSYYSLGFQLGPADAGRDLKTKVAVDRPGVRVRYRQTLRHKSPGEKIAERARAALDHGLVENPLGISLAAGETLAMDGERSVVPLEVGIPLAKVALLPDDGERRGRLTLYLVNRDARGHTSPPRSAPIEIRIPEADLAGALGQLYLYRVKMLMGPGEHTVAVGLYDEQAGTASYVTSHVEVAAP